MLQIERLYKVTQDALAEYERIPASVWRDAGLMAVRTDQDFVQSRDHLDKAWKSRHLAEASISLNPILEWLGFRHKLPE